MDIREEYEKFEKEYIDKRGVLSANTRGRKIYEEPCSIRTEFQRDRDRITHSKSFRRLKDKTQVFMYAGDHFRTRLTHTLEVAGISRTIARSLRLNEDLVEAIALGHDLGHSPFGHSGEYILNEILMDLCEKDNDLYYKLKDTYGLKYDTYYEYQQSKEYINQKAFLFSHSRQSKRVVEFLEKGGAGLNLTEEVLDGIRNHNGSVTPFTLEGQIVKIADRIAYLNHDIDDAIRGGVIKEDDIPADILNILGRTHSERITTLVKDMINASKNSDVIRQSPEIKNAMSKLRNYMFEEVYVDSLAKKEEKKVKRLIKELFYFYLKNPEEIPREYVYNDNEQIINIIDYISGMTDHYAAAVFESKFLPKGAK